MRRGGRGDRHLDDDLIDAPLDVPILIHLRGTTPFLNPNCSVIVLSSVLIDIKPSSQAVHERHVVQRFKPRCKVLTEIYR